MLVKLFILGRPGSGKSTAAGFIRWIAKQQGWQVSIFNDYKLLYSKAQSDDKRFELIQEDDKKGFSVNDPLVLDEVLSEIENRVQKSTRPLMQKKLVIIEFARSEYREAFKTFGLDFLQGAYFLFLDARIEICIQRVKQRALYQAQSDDRFVPEKAIRIHYSLDDISSIEETLESTYGIDRDRVRIINNNFGSLRFFKEIYRFTNGIVGEILGKETEQLSAISHPTQDKGWDEQCFSETEPIPVVSLPQEVDESSAAL